MHFIWHTGSYSSSAPERGFKIVKCSFVVPRNIPALEYDMRILFHNYIVFTDINIWQYVVRQGSYEISRTININKLSVYTHIIIYIYIIMLYVSLSHRIFNQRALSAWHSWEVNSSIEFPSDARHPKSPSISMFQCLWAQIVRFIGKTPLPNMLTQTINSTRVQMK